MPESSAAWIKFADAAVAGSDNNTAVAAQPKEQRVLCATVFEFDEKTGACSNHHEVQKKETLENGWAIIPWKEWFGTDICDHKAQKEADL